MGLARRAKLYFDAKMKLYVPCLKPGSTALCKFRRFGDFDEPQLFNVKSARLFFFTCRHGKLDMVDGKYFHSEFHKAGRHPALWLDRQPGIDPGGEPAKQCLDADIAVL